MRIALLQIQLDPDSRAANIQALRSAIHRAAGATPAPDLLVLPGACDTGGVMGQAGLCEAGLAAVRAGLSDKAREWGLFIGAGLHTFGADGLAHQVVIFDADGDAVVRSGLQSTSSDDGDVLAPQWCFSGVGRLGAYDAAQADPTIETLATDVAGAMVVVSHARSTTRRESKLMDRTIGSLRESDDCGRGMFWAVVGVARSGPTTQGGANVVTFLRGPNGAVLGSAKPYTETILHLQVPIEPAG